MLSLLRNPLSFIFLPLILCKITTAQNLDDNQKDVWNNFISYWSSAEHDYCDGDINDFQKNCPGWSFENGKALDRTAAITNIINHQHRGELNARLTPLEIRIDADIAFVTYTCSGYKKSTDNGMHTKNWTDMLIRNGKKWLVVGIHSGNDRITLK